MDDNRFYMVSFEASGNFYFFHDHEDACAFLLESYFDENDIEDEKECVEINNAVADEGGIEGYGWVDPVSFMK